MTELTAEQEARAKRFFQDDCKRKNWFDAPTWENLHAASQEHYRRWVLNGIHPRDCENCE